MYRKYLGQKVFVTIFSVFVWKILLFSIRRVPVSFFFFNFNQNRKNTKRLLLKFLLTKFTKALSVFCGVFISIQAEGRSSFNWCNPEILNETEIIFFNTKNCCSYIILVSKIVILAIKGADILKL